MEFKGTLVIVDPVYIGDYSKNPDWWSKASYGKNMDVVGMSHYICRDIKHFNCFQYFIGNKTLEYNQFRSDSGLILITTLDQITQFNPKFIDWAKKHKHFVSIIPKFNGEVCTCFEKDYDDVRISIYGNDCYFGNFWNESN